MSTIVNSDSKNVKPIYKGTQIVWYILYLIEIILMFRLILKLIGANPAGFTNFVYSISYPLALPFLYVVHSPEVLGSVFEWTTLLAMLVYWVVAVAIVKLFLIGKPVSNVEAEVKLEQQDEKVNS
ncbi:MAG: YggT family protein [Candidatus Taylorbacteria bacterium]